MVKTETFKEFAVVENMGTVGAENGFELTKTVTECAEGTLLQMSLKNCSGRTVSVREIGFHREGVCGDDLDIPKERIALWVEGWQMASPCGLRVYGDRNFVYNPDYLISSLSAPYDYTEEVNHFYSDNMVLVKDRGGSFTWLAGFVTTGNQFGHFRCVLGENGLASLDMVCALDGRLLEDGETVISEKILIKSGADTQSLLADYASLWGTLMNARLNKPLPVGWCSWYYFFGKVTAADVASNASFAAANRERMPMSVIQVDAGYFTYNGDWLTPNEKFPGGLPAMAADIRSKGLVAGAWFGPFMIDEQSDFFKQHPECVVHQENGEPLEVWGSKPGMRKFALDGTHPVALDYLRSVFQKVRSYGIDYIKLDFLVNGAIDGVRYDRKATRAQAVRRALLAIREGFGEDGFICTCTAPFASCVGIADSERIATDFLPAWRWNEKEKDFSEAPTAPNVCRNVLYRTYMNRRLWWNDPDTLLVRDTETRLNAKENDVWYQTVRLTGGALLSGDDMPSLSPERLEAAMALYRNPSAFDSYVEDMWERKLPGIVCARNRKTGETERWLFNLTNEPLVLEGKTVEPHSVQQC